MTVLEITATFLTMSAAWLLAALFLRRESLSMLGGALVGAFVGSGCVFALGLAGLTMPAPGYLLLFAAVALGLKTQEKMDGESGVLLGLAAVSAWGLFAFFKAGMDRFAGAEWLAHVAWAAFAAVFAAVAGALCRQVLPRRWTDLFCAAPEESGRWQRGGVRVCLAVGLLAAVELLLLPVGGVESLPGFLSRLALGALAWVAAAAAVGLLAALEQGGRTAEDERSYRREMESFMNVIRSQRHDYNFHIHTLAGLIRQGDMAECQAYLEELVGDTAEMNRILLVKDPAVAALINRFRVEAARRSIRLYIEIEDDLSRIATNVYETNKIIGNLLQNAIDEVAGQQDKSYGIHLSILKRGEFCMIHVSNRVERPVDQIELMERVYRQGYTTKQGHEGVGLSSVQALTRRYNGEVYARMEGEIVHFVASIPMHYAGGEQYV